MIALIGFGEAGRVFGQALGARGQVVAFDIADRREACAAAGVTCADTLADALGDTAVVLSLVTADQALDAARAAAAHVAPGTWFFDMNSVAPETKRLAAAAIAAAGAHYVDVAVMAPVDPAALMVPLLVAGPGAAQGVVALGDAGFGAVATAGDTVGRASAIKMIRSVMVKGSEALTAEMMLAARAAGVEDEVLASLGDGWRSRATYNLERMTTHGARRAAEMEEAARTLVALGIDPVMTRGTIVRQRAMATPPMRAAA